MPLAAVPSAASASSIRRRSGRRGGKASGTRRTRWWRRRRSRKRRASQRAYPRPSTAASPTAVTSSSRCRLASARTLEAYALRVGAEFEVVVSFAHEAIAGLNATLQAGANSHFIKLPLMQWYRYRYDQLLFLDDDVLVSPRTSHASAHHGAIPSPQLLFLDDDVLVSPYTANVFAATPCQELGAVYEGFHKQGWHAMHGRAFCSLYGLEATLPSVCSPEAVKRARIFNSGVMVMSGAHVPLLDGWDRRKLECRILCDQLYLNAMVRQRGVCVRHLGDSYNLPGSEVRRVLAISD